MIDIAHASHHADYLSKAIELGNLVRGLLTAPKMMLMYADATTEAEWQEQIRVSTLGFMKVAERHHKRIIEKRIAETTDLQTQTLQAIDASETNAKQKKALKGTYEELLKAAAGAARKVKDERDLATQSKSHADGPRNKRPRTDSERYNIHAHCHTVPDSDTTNTCISLAPQTQVTTNQHGRKPRHPDEEAGRELRPNTRQGGHQNLEKTLP